MYNNITRTLQPCHENKIARNPEKNNIFIDQKTMKVTWNNKRLLEVYYITSIEKMSYETKICPDNAAH